MSPEAPPAATYDPVDDALGKVSGKVIAKVIGTETARRLLGGGRSG